uniref:Disease resistance R13L4/SHOC-2-like LRR domain-containing protein n=1 Tax=Graphocephala atropunctata TaxID=36148 RepID=A0A1B6KXJ3_9HEMI
MPLSCFSWCQATEENAVKEMDLSNSALHDVPHSIFLHERTLDTLLLNSNRIRDLPLPLFYCQNLQSLNLSDNEIDSLPAAIGSLVHLRTLDLNRNCVGEVNESIKGCRKLSVLNLSMNPLRQFPEPVTQLISLEELYLNDTGLDYLPANVGRLVHLRILELRDNKLSSLPKAVARFSRLLRLDIGQNDFTTLPEVVGELHELQELWLDLNGTLEIPLFLGNLKRLTHMDISENRLDELPDEVGECRMLTELTVSSNDLRFLPTMIGRISNLVTLKLDMNELTSLPMTIGDLFNLEELYVASNRLETLPSSIGLLRKLVSLGLDSNQLQLLPPEIGSCTSLRVLTVQNNLLKSIPAEIGNLQNLTVLSLTNNVLRNLPMSVLKLRSLKALWLVYNQSKPLTPLVKDWDPRTGSMVLTCYMLPQTQSVSDLSHHTEDYVNTVNLKKKTNEKLKIRFSINPALERQSILFRAPTPYPKKLRELAKCARAIASQCNHSIPDQNGDSSQLSVANVSGANVLVDQVRTAVVKKHTPAGVNGSSLSGQTARETDTPVQWLQQPPPYHVAAAFSKQAPFFQKTAYLHKEERRTDIDTEALSTLKDELLHHLPNDCQLSQSEQSGSVELIYPVSTAQCHEGDVDAQNPTARLAMSDVDSAFVDNIDSSYRTVDPTPPSQNGNGGTYSARPGIITIDNYPEEPLPFDSSIYPISKVNNWLCSKIKDPATESGCELINMYPCESYKSDIRGSSSSVAMIGKTQEELITSSKITKPSKVPWLFGVHKNPKVVC